MRIERTICSACVYYSWIRKNDRVVGKTYPRILFLSLSIYLFFCLAREKEMGDKVDWRPFIRENAISLSLSVQAQIVRKRSEEMS